LIITIDAPLAFSSSELYLYVSLLRAEPSRITNRRKLLIQSPKAGPKYHPKSTQKQHLASKQQQATLTVAQLHPSFDRQLPRQSINFAHRKCVKTHENRSPSIANYHDKTSISPIENASKHGNVSPSIANYHGKATISPIENTSKRTKLDPLRSPIAAVKHYFRQSRTRQNTRISTPFDRQLPW